MVQWLLGGIWCSPDQISGPNASIEASILGFLWVRNKSNRPEPLKTTTSEDKIIYEHAFQWFVAVITSQTNVLLRQWIPSQNYQSLNISQLTLGSNFNCCIQEVFRVTVETANLLNEWAVLLILMCLLFRTKVTPGEVSKLRTRLAEKKKIRNWVVEYEIWRR